VPPMVRRLADGARVAEAVPIHRGTAPRAASYRGGLSARSQTKPPPPPPHPVYSRHPPAGLCGQAPRRQCRLLLFVSLPRHRETVRGGTRVAPGTNRRAIRAAGPVIGPALPFRACRAVRSIPAHRRGMVRLSTVKAATGPVNRTGTPLLHVPRGQTPEAFERPALKQGHPAPGPPQVHHSLPR